MKRIVNCKNYVTGNDCRYIFLNCVYINYIFRIFVFVASISLAGLSPEHVEASEAAAVDITSFMPSGEIKQGSGFFYAKDSSILTAYHVVQGANKIHVTTVKGTHSLVRVEYVSGEHDIAILSITDLKNSPGHYALDYSNKVPSYKDDVYVIGSPRGSGQHYIRSYVTSGKYVKSKTIRAKNGGTPFEKNINVLTLDLTNYSGMSGAPVMASNGVISVFSGSYDEGGALGWMIPSMYITQGNVVSIRKYPDQIASWPRLELMKSNFRDLMKSFRVDAKGNTAISSYLNHIEQLSSLFEKRIVAAAKLQAAAQLVMLYSSVAKTEKDIAGGPILDYAEAFDQYGVVSTRIGQTKSKLVSALSQAANWYRRDSGITDAQDKAMSDAIDLIVAHYPELSRGYYETIGMDSNSVIRQILVDMDRLTKSNVLATQKDAMMKLGSLTTREFAKLSTVESFNYQSLFINQHRELGKILLDSLKYFEN